MSSTMSWLGPGLLAIGGTVVGALGPLGLGLLNRRSERRRLARAQKVETYPVLVDAAGRLATLPVWPDDQDPEPLRRKVETVAHQVAFFGPARVGATLGPLLVAAQDVADTVVLIRAESRPGHRGQVDQRLAPPHDAAVLALTDAVTVFATAGRADLEIRGGYTPVGAAVVGDQTGKIAREPGAGSREPGAGSRDAD